MWLLATLLASGAALAQPAEPTTEPTTEPTEPGEPTDEDRRAQVLFANGKRLYDEGSYEAAIEAWEACYEISERLALLYNLSNAYERVGRFKHALDLLNTYRAKASLSPEEHERLARKASTLEVRWRTEESTETVTKTRAGRGLGPGIGVTAAGGVAVLAGAVLGGLALDARGSASAACADVEEGRICQDFAASDISRVGQLGTASVVALGIGGLGVITGVSLLATGERNPGAGVEVTLSL